MIELFDYNLRMYDGQSSKGNQLKWKVNDIWYKADYAGYEGLAEYVVSKLLAKSNIKNYEYVEYDSDQVKYKYTVFNCAKSHDFLKDGWQIITLNRLYQIKYNRDFTKDIWHIHGIENRLQFLVDQVVKITSLNDFGQYMNKILTIDAVFLNEDRHLHNIGVLMGADGSFDYCPIFDHGAALLSDTTIDYPLGVDIYKLIAEVKAKTICTDFEEALEASEKLYGSNIHFNFTHNEVSDILKADKNYNDEIKDRVQRVIFEQMRKYPYLFLE